MFELLASRSDRAILCGRGPRRRDLLHAGALAAVGLSLPQYARAAAEALRAEALPGDAGA